MLPGVISVQSDVHCSDCFGTDPYRFAPIGANRRSLTHIVPTECALLWTIGKADVYFHSMTWGISW